MTHSPLHTLDAPALAWLRADRRWRQLSLGTRAQLRWRSAWASLNRKLSEGRVADAAPLQAPLFIVGPWRSGTTVMHELLTAATSWPTPLTWQCMNATAFQLLPAPPARSGVARPMDGLEISALSPQEDEFALLTLGVDSAYRGFLMPERLPELLHTLDPAHWQANTADWLPRFERFMAGVLASAGQPGRRLILKSPNHSFRLPALLQRFPQAQVVWMARDAATVFHSNRKMWQAMFAEHRLSTGAADGLDAFLGTALQQCAHVLASLQATVPADRWVTVDQADLARDPQGTVQHALAQLQLELTDPAALQAALGRTRQGRIERYDTPVPAVAAAGVAALDAAQRR
ncbi:sulfotransferase family protein [Roseateles sp. BYS87W]|uniref:Sulfotransferase family protein n=1 Tax=Pelomonas baiyunensis TaxID=3299026 RepID=A0ABW7H390_9BURK